MDRVKVGINGFGRIGRQIARTIRERHNDTLDLVAINDLTDNASLAHLLKFDSILGRLPYDVSLEGEDTIVVGDTKIKALDVKAGDKILFGKYSGTDIKIDGEEYLILREDEVLAVIS